jgi:hypothetical protein
MYERMALRPELAGAAQVIDALALPGVAATFCGALGTNDDVRAASALSLGRSSFDPASVPEHAAAMPAAMMKVATLAAPRRVKLSCVTCFRVSSCCIAATPLTKFDWVAPAFLVMALPPPHLPTARGQLRDRAARALKAGGVPKRAIVPKSSCELFHNANVWARNPLFRIHHAAELHARGRAILRTRSETNTDAASVFVMMEFLFENENYSTR